MIRKMLNVSILILILLPFICSCKSLSDRQGAEAKDRQKQYHSRFKERIAADKKIYTEKQLAKAEEMYRKANGKGWMTSEAKASLEKMIEQYPQSNRAGCGTLYLAQWADGEEMERLLLKAIEKYNDSYYGDGVQVGPYARWILADYYIDIGLMEKSDRLWAELKTNYPDAIDHKGRLLKNLELNEFQKKYRFNFKQRAAADRKHYSKEQLDEIEKMYQKANGNGWKTEEAKISLEKMIEMYPESNRAGCGTLYLAQWAKGEEREKLLKKAIEKYNDSFYGDGVQVGALARFLLANYYEDTGSKAEATALYAELEADYAEAIDHKGKLITKKPPTETPDAL